MSESGKQPSGTPSMGASRMEPPSADGGSGGPPGVPPGNDDRGVAAESGESRQKFLAEASAILSTSLDFKETLANLAAICVPFLGDWCAIDVLENGTPIRVAVVHNDPEKVELAQRLRELYPPDVEAEGLRGVVSEGKSLLYPTIPDELLKQAVRDEQHLEIIRGLGLHSAIVVPLNSGGRPVGILTLVSAESRRVYGAADLALMEDLGHRAGLAVENARLYRESQEILEQLRRANESKDEFLGLVSHELRTPITTIYGGARLLRLRSDRLDEESTLSVIADIEQEAERLYRIVENLLVLARVELGEEVRMEPILVQRIAERTAQIFNRRRPGRRVIIKAGVMPAVRASAIYLEQIMRNLLNNADKYSPSDTPIEIAAEAAEAESTISVNDRGPGIPAEEVELVFERFYRSASSAGQAGGAGLGLTVCKRLVEAQNGRIWAESREGGGLSVSFTLPLYSESE